MIASHRAKFIIVLISIYQAVFGLYGLHFLFRVDSNNILDYIAALLFFYPVFSSYQLYYRKKVTYSIINFAFQLVQFKIGHFGIQYIIGTYFGIGFYIDQIKGFIPTFEFLWAEASIALQIGSGPEVYAVELNLIAVIILWLLFKLLDRKENLGSTSWID
tara:strand:+ start:741 stop:1220 length:480 start_codon:yes stop_codon:yes gene_type:complete